VSVAEEYLGAQVRDHRHPVESAPPLQALNSALPSTPSMLGRSSQIDARVINRLIDRLGAQMTARLARKLQT
jgi:hypothetical protein